MTPGRTRKPPENRFLLRSKSPEGKIASLRGEAGGKVRHVLRSSEIADEISSNRACTEQMFHRFTGFDCS